MRDSNLQMQDVFVDFFFDRELGVCSVIALSNRDSESVVFHSGQKMALRAVYVVIF